MTIINNSLNQLFNRMHHVDGVPVHCIRRHNSTTIRRRTITCRAILDWFVFLMLMSTGTSKHCIRLPIRIPMFVRAFSSPLPINNSIRRRTRIDINPRRQTRYRYSNSICSLLHPFSPLSPSPSLSRSSRVDDFDSSIGMTRDFYSRPVVQWYPGHIAKAERMLAETIRAVDVVVEVRDARIPAATSHPQTAAWCAGKPRLIVYTHLDAIPKLSQRLWKESINIFGAEHYNQENHIDKQIRNQAAQAAAERIKYTTGMSMVSNQKKNNDNDNNRKNHESNNAKSSTVVAPVEDVLFVNAKQGVGIHALVRAIHSAGEYVQERRIRRGLQHRPLRVAVLGMPNVGKSALINKLIGGKKRAKTANLPGVTRSLNWIRVGFDETSSQRSKNKSFELLDSPGIIPAVLENQSDAMLLAACNCIGEAAYDNQAAAAYLSEWLLTVHRLGYERQVAPVWRVKCQERYKFDPIKDKQIDVEDDGVTPIFAPRTGEDILFQVADNTCQGNPEDAARKIIQDFRSGRMGPICLQVAPQSEMDKGQVDVMAKRNKLQSKQQQELNEQLRKEQQEKAQNALKVAKEQGLELPPLLQQQPSRNSKDTSSKKNDNDEIGKGMFDGW